MDEWSSNIQEQTIHEYPLAIVVHEYQRTSSPQISKNELSTNIQGRVFYKHLLTSSTQISKDELSIYSIFTDECSTNIH